LDLDGTIIDSEPGILSSCRAALLVLGHKPDLSLNVSKFIGSPLEEVMCALLEPYGDQRTTEAVKAYRADYGQSGLFKSMPYPGIEQALKEIRQSGARLFLATSKRRHFAERILDHFGFTPFFEAIYGPEADGALSHKPELIAHVIEKHALPKLHCVMVGDRRYDIEGAHANDMRALGVLWGYGSREELEGVRADALISEPALLSQAALALAEGC
jgi:phosphoglycolate phosphatase